MEDNLTTHQLINNKGLEVNHDSVALYKTACQGEVDTPADAGYEKVRKIWIASLDKCPAILDSYYFTT